jgi:hypothetical protein
MALWVCGGEGGCGTKYAVGLSRCPRCHNTEFFEDGDPMAKISRRGGASDKTLPTPEVESAAAAETDPAPEAAADQPEIATSTDSTPEPEPMDITEHMAGPAEPVAEGGEEPSAGNNSSASTGPQPTTSEPSSKPRRKPARTTANRSTPDLTGGSSAPSTAGEKTEATSASDGGEPS